MSTYYTNEGIFYEQSKRIKLKRNMLNLNQTQLAKMCKTSTATIWRIEHCETANENLYARIEGTLDKILKNKDELITHFESLIANYEELIDILKEI